MAMLGGSPLGLIGVGSIKSISGLSSFNVDKSRNINVSNYNSGKDIYPIQNLEDNTYGGVKTENISQGTRSMFTGPTVIAPYGMIGKEKTDTGAFGASSKYIGVKRNQLHNDQIYDTSLLNILQKLSGTEAQLRPADFAYLKDVGVFPNNRLMIARRFTKPHLDNIFGKVDKSLAMAVMISWKPQGDSFLEISFGEEWTDASGDFKDVLNSLGKDFLINSLGDRTGGLAGAIPLPGFTESLQRQILKQMGLMEDGTDTPLPSGNPNLIKEAKRRKTIGYEGTGSGLKCTVQIKMECEWEQKFLSGIDPTIVFQDLLNKILVFATSKSSNYGLTPEFEKKIEQWTYDPGSILKDMMSYIKNALTKVVEDVKSAIASIVNPEKEANIKEGNVQNTLLETFTGTLSTQIDAILSRTIQKYKIEIQGIARTLSGAPSTPWHITIGNPLRPIFCAGDMYMSDNLTLDLGPTLAFNDLPSNIKASFTLTNARPWGLQEIIAKFNAGSIRVSTTIKDDMALNPGDPKNAIDADKGAPNSNSNSKKSDINLPVAVSNTLSTKEQGPGFTGGFGGGGFSGGGAVGSYAANTPAVSNPVNTNSIATVTAGAQSTDNTIPTFANGWGTSLPDTSKLTSGISTNISGEQTAVASVQNQVTSGATNTQNFVTTNLSAANASKDEVSSSVMNSVATQTSGVIPFDTSIFNNVIV